jgi:glutamine amidotransferase
LEQSSSSSSSSWRSCSSGAAAEIARLRRESSRTFLAHIRFASTGALTLANTHPFEQEGRLLAHNGVLAGLSQLDDELGEDRVLVEGETDSERLFALITRETRRRQGNIRAGIVAAAS